MSENTRISVAQWRTAGPEFIAAAQEWAKANGINPYDVSMTRHGIVVFDGMIQYHEFVRSEKGGTFIDMTGEHDDVATAFRRVPLIVPMPDEWPTCPTCGR